jgi:NTE family protein
VAFVLTGGGTLGAVQVGMLRALVERGVRADVVLGSSVGALNAAAFAQDPTPHGVDVLERAWRTAKDNLLFHRGRLWSLKQLATKRDAVYQEHTLGTLIDAFLSYDRIEDAALPCAVMASALSGHPERCFWSGPARPLLLASSALPGIFPPVTIDGERYIDGGVINNMPVTHAVSAGASLIYILLCGPRLAETEVFGPRPVDHILGAFALARKARALQDLDRLPPHVEALVLPGPEAPKLYYVDLSHTDALMARGYEVANAFLDAAGELVGSERPSELAL